MSASRPTRDLGRLGRKAREAQGPIVAELTGDAGEAPRAPIAERALERMLAARSAASGAQRSARPPRVSARLRMVAALAVAACLLLVCFGSYAWLRPAPLSFTVGDTGVAHAGAFVAAPEGRAVAVAFSDGTQFVVDARSRARVGAVSPEGAELQLEDGTLDATVVKRPGARWNVLAGPYQVRVTGTAFGVTWEPDRQHFRIEMREGSVRISGPGIDGEAALGAGERMDGWADSSRIAVGPVDASTAKGAALVASVQPGSPGVPAARSPSATRASGDPSPGADASSSASAAPTSEDFRGLARHADYKGALAQARKQGVDALLGSLDAAGLYTLSEVGRLGGDGALAERALSELRARFPKDGQARTAAFFLGRVAFDQRASYGAAAKWFALYLSEGGGPYAREAAGRLIEARERSGDGAGALAAAKSYLSSYPDGPHAAHARLLVDKAQAAPTEGPPAGP